MAIKLTVYVSDEEGPIHGLSRDADQDTLNKIADSVLNVANKHAEYFMYRTGDAVISGD